MLLDFYNGNQLNKTNERKTKIKKYHQPSHC